MRTIYIYISLILMSLLLLGGQAYSQERRTEILIDFRVNSTRIDTLYKDNSSRISDLVSFLHDLRTDSTVRISGVTFCGAASPEGSYEYNTQLAHGRMAALEDFVRERMEIPDSIITRDNGYISWDHIISLVESSDLAYREEVLSILREEAELVSYLRGERIDRRVVKLKGLDGGKVWKELEREYFSSMRNAGVVFITLEAVPCLLPLDAVSEPLPLEAESPSYGMSYAEAERPGYFAMSLRTNMLYDALLTPNIGVEFHLGKGFTAGANWMYAWWSNDISHFYWRVYGGDISFRKYFGRASKEKPLRGHHLGVYAMGVTYDFLLGEDGKGIMGGIPGGDIFDMKNYGAGIEYGYSLPVSAHLNIDFTIGIGYLGGEYREYRVMDDCYVWQSTKYRNYWGPTKAEVSLVWLIGRGNVNLKKGGAR